jgi:hypothetical protein
MAVAAIVVMMNGMIDRRLYPSIISPSLSAD